MSKLVIEGVSDNKKITLYAQNIVSTATYNKDGSISSTVRYIHPEPEVTSILDVFKDFKDFAISILKTVLIFALILAVIIFTPILDIVVYIVAHHFWAGVVSIYLIHMLKVTFFIAPWHGAEHMAIAAYNNTGGYDIRTIKNEEPTHKQCGARFIVPQFVAAIIASFLFYIANMRLIPLIIFIAAILMCGKFHDTKLTQKISILIQRIFLVRHPGEIELLTAHTALKNLVETHKKIEREDTPQDECTHKRPVHELMHIIERINDIKNPRKIKI